MDIPIAGIVPNNSFNFDRFYTPQRFKQKAGQIGRKADLDGLSARRVKGMDTPNHAFCVSINYNPRLW
jgi:hypothetical protein